MTFEQEPTASGDRPVALTGHTVVDAQMMRIGRVTDVLADDGSAPTWAVVKTGLLGGEHFVPLRHTYVDEAGRLVVPLRKTNVKHAPRVGREHVLTPEVRRALRDYYGVAA